MLPWSKRPARLRRHHRERARSVRGREDLRTEGVALDQEPVVGLDGTWQAWVKDPDGNAIDLMQLSEDSPQYKAASSAGE